MSYVDGRRSAFPDNGVDQFLELYNLPASQRGNMRRFQELKLKADLTTAEQNELNSLTVTLQHYIIDVEKWNKFADAIVNVERFFLESVEPYMDGKKIEITDYTESKKLEFQAEVDKMTYRGEWQPGTQYFKKNVVTSGGEGFIAKFDNTNQPPPNATCWGKIAGKGAKGDPSLNINFKGEYDPSVSYTLGDATTYGGLWYYATKNTLGNPPTNVDYWELQTNQTLIGDTQPFDNRITGWVDTTL